MKLCFDKNVTWKQQLLHFIHSMLQLLKCGIQTFSLWTGITGLTPFGHFWITLKKRIVRVWDSQLIWKGKCSTATQLFPNI